MGRIIGAKLVKLTRELLMLSSLFTSRWHLVQYYSSCHVTSLTWPCSPPLQHVNEMCGEFWKHRRFLGNHVQFMEQHTWVGCCEKGVMCD